MPTYLYPALALLVVSVVVLCGWLAWLAFNWLVFMTAGSPDAFDRTAQLAPAFLRSLRSRSDEDISLPVIDQAGAESKGGNSASHSRWLLPPRRHRRRTST